MTALSEKSNRDRARRKLAMLGAGLAGAAFAIVVTAVVWFALNRNHDPAVTSDRLAAAEQIWQATGPANYNISITLQKRTTEVHYVEVRDGQVTQYTLDGRPLNQRRTIDTWSVPGMFGTIAADLENVNKVAQGEAAPNTPRLTLRGTFDATYGFPNKYRRIQRGSDFEVSWEVTKFEVIEN